MGYGVYDEVGRFRLTFSMVPINGLFACVRGTATTIAGTGGSSANVRVRVPSDPGWYKGVDDPNGECDG